MAKKKTKQIWGGYKQYTLEDGTKFLARDDSDANLYRIRCRNIENSKKVVGVVLWKLILKTMVVNWNLYVKL